MLEINGRVREAGHTPVLLLGFVRVDVAAASVDSLAGTASVQRAAWMA
jgi:hypothetical protein